MSGIFGHINPAPLLVRIRSRECGTYMYMAMKFVGWLPPKLGFKRYIYLFWSLMVFIFSTVYLPIGYDIAIVTDFKNLTHAELLGVLEKAFNVWGGTAKTIIVLTLFSRLQQTMSLLDKLDERLQNDNDRRRIHKAVARCNNIFLNYGKFFLCCLISIFISGVFIGQPPWLVYNPLFDWRNGVILFWLQAILEHIIVSISATVTLILDTFPIIFMIIFRAHVEVLKDHIRDMRTDPHKTEAENYEEMMCLIEDHRMIKACCQLMRPIFAHTTFIQFLLIGVVLGLSLINALYFTGLFDAVASFLYLIAILLETFPFCFLCDLIVKDCEDLSNLIGQSHWIDAEPKYKTTLLIFMHNLQQPIIFKAGGIFPISMNSSIKVAKFAFSVMTIVEKMNLVDRLQ